MSDHKRLTVYFYLFLLTSVTACGILGSDDDGFFKVKPISAVEVALEISGNPGDQIAISREGEERYNFQLSQPDTVIYDGGLQPATTYTWSMTNQQVIDSQVLTARRQATTLDTTSSNFTWQTFSFGEHSSSVLYGVSIIDENNIWAVGEIYMNDSTGQAEETPYNILHWNGEEWNKIRLTYNCRLYFPNCGPVTDLYARATSIKTFSENDVWITAGSLHHYDGESWKQYEGVQGIGNANATWGYDSNELWFVGNNGFVAHKKGQDWQKIETNTELDVYDIHGNGEQGVVAVAGKQSQSSDKLILRINEDLTTEPLPTKPIPFSISGIWFDQSGVTYMAGSRISLKSNINSSVPWRILDKEAIGHPYLFAIDANGLNDIVATGGFGEIVHFNGAAWTLYEQEITGNLYDISINGNIVVAVGLNGRQAFITIGKRE